MKYDAGHTNPHNAIATPDDLGLTAEERRELSATAEDACPDCHTIHRGDCW